LCLLPPILLMLWSLGYCSCDSTPIELDYCYLTISHFWKMFLMFPCSWMIHPNSNSMGWSSSLIVKKWNCYWPSRMKLVQFDCHWNFHTLKNGCMLDVPKMFLIDWFFIVGNINHDFPIQKFHESTTTICKLIWPYMNIYYNLGTTNWLWRPTWGRHHKSFI
jgi:hypothetical protein